jgi:hypothetical protein
MNAIVKYFAAMLVGSAVAGIIGSVLGIILAAISPELVKGMLYTETEAIVRYSAASGLIWGFLLGGVGMGFCIFVSALTSAIRYRVDKLGER